MSDNLVHEITQADALLREAEAAVSEAGRRLRQARRELSDRREELSSLIRELSSGESRYPLLERFASNGDRIPAGLAADPGPKPVEKPAAAAGPAGKARKGRKAVAIGNGLPAADADSGVPDEEELERLASRHWNVHQYAPDKPDHRGRRLGSQLARNLNEAKQRAAAGWSGRLVIGDSYPHGPDCGCAAGP